MQGTKMISEEDFTDVWGAGTDVLSYEDVKHADRKFVWTIVEDDDDNWVAIPGFRVVNVIGYCLTLKPWETGLEVAMWAEGFHDDNDDEGEEE